MEYQVRIIGALLVVLGLVHAVFPSYFNWKQELQLLTLINRQIMVVHTFFIAITLIMMGLLCITSASELIQTGLGKRISLGLGIFWSFRFIIQLFGYSTKLWKGKTFETVIHVLFSISWGYLSIIFLSIALSGTV